MTDTETAKNPERWRPSLSADHTRDVDVVEPPCQVTPEGYDTANTAQDATSGQVSALLFHSDPTVRVRHKMPLTSRYHKDENRYSPSNQHQYAYPGHGQ